MLSVRQDVEGGSLPVSPLNCEERRLRTGASSKARAVSPGRAPSLPSVTASCTRAPSAPPPLDMWVRTPLPHASEEPGGPS